MRLLQRPFLVITMLIIVLAAAGAIAGALYLGVFSPHPQLALDTFNGVYGTAGTRLDTCNTCHTTGRSTNVYGTHLKSEFSRVKYFLRDESLIKDHKLDTFRAGLRDIDELDSDNDGYSNLAEIGARTFPGDPKDHPVTEQQ
jgi:hypothetical protein